MRQSFNQWVLDKKPEFILSNYGETFYLDYF